MLVDYSHSISRNVLVYGFNECSDFKYSELKAIASIRRSNVHLLLGMKQNKTRFKMLLRTTIDSRNQWNNNAACGFNARCKQNENADNQREMWMKIFQKCTLHQDVTKKIK